VKEIGTVKVHFSKIWLIIAMLLASTMLGAEVSAALSPIVEWQKIYGAAETHCAIQTLDGGYALGGTVDLPQGTTCYFMKVNSSGGMKWNTTLGDLIGIVSAALQTSDGDYALTGARYGLFLVKIDGSGNVILNKTYEGMGDDFASRIFATSDGGYLIAGTMRASTGAHLPSHAWLIRTDSDGNVVWSQTYGLDDLVAATQTSDNGCAILTRASGGNLLLVKLDQNGQTAWNQTYRGSQSSSCVFYSLTQTSDGGYAIATTVSNGHSNNAFWLAKADTLGNIQWSRTYVGPGNYTINWSLINTNDSGFAMIGNTNMNSAVPYGGGVRIWVLKTDTNGTLQWSQTYGGPNGTDGRIIIQTIDGGYALVGGMTKMYENNYPEFMYIAKLSFPAQTCSGIPLTDLVFAVLLAIVLAIVIAYATFAKRRRPVADKQSSASPRKAVTS
jgi:hypothetical protein